MKLFDSHAHYFDRRFAEEVEGGADAVLKAIMPSPVYAVINVGTNCENSKQAVEQASHYDGMYAAVGIHPEDCHFVAEPDAALSELRTLLGDRAHRERNKIVALGEIGLDYHWEHYGEIPMDRAKQAYFFEAQMKLAEELSLPVIIHDREAHGDCFETVLRYPHVRGVFHSYSGSAEMARELIKRGWYLSFSGTITFKNATRVREAALAVPRDRLLMETDAPYLSPHPHRGKLNHSGRLECVAQTLAQLWNCTPQEAAQTTAANAEQLFLSSKIV